MEVIQLNMSGRAVKGSKYLILPKLALSINYCCLKLQSQVNLKIAIGVIG